MKDIGCFKYRKIKLFCIIMCVLLFSGCANNHAQDDADEGIQYIDEVMMAEDTTSKTTVSENITIEGDFEPDETINSEDSNQEEDKTNWLEEINDTELVEYINSVLVLNDGEIIDEKLTGWIEDGVCYRVAINRPEEEVEKIHNDYAHLRDVIFVKNEVISTVDVDYFFLTEDEWIEFGYEMPLADRHVFAFSEFEVSYVDLTFDGNKDILIFLGHDGNVGTRYACAYIYTDGEYIYNKSFESITNYSIVEDEKCIEGWYEYTGYRYEYINGSFVKTYEWTIDPYDPSTW